LLLIKKDGASLFTQLTRLVTTVANSVPIVVNKMLIGTALAAGFAGCNAKPEILQKNEVIESSSTLADPVAARSFVKTKRLDGIPDNTSIAVKGQTLAVERGFGTSTITLNVVFTKSTSAHAIIAMSPDVWKSVSIDGLPDLSAQVERLINNSEWLQPESGTHWTLSEPNGVWVTKIGINLAPVSYPGPVLIFDFEVLGANEK